MKTAITITVRLKSTRLPKKALLKIEDKTLIEHLIERLKRSKLADMIILCTSTNPQDDELIPIAKKWDISYFRGSEDDVLNRLYNAAIDNNVSFIVSCTGDNPLTDPEYIDRIISKFKETNADYITVLDLPWGTFSYGVKVEALRKVIELKKEKDTEVWGYYFTSSNIFKVERVEVENYLKCPSLRLTVDTHKDFKLMQEIYKELYTKNPAFSLYDVVRLINEDKPRLKKINEKIKQKTPANIDVTRLSDKGNPLILKRRIIYDLLQRMSNENQLSQKLRENPTIFLLNLPAGFHGEMEVHDNEDDLYFILEGEAELQIGENINLVKENDIIHIPAKRKHKLSQTKKGIKYIVVKINNEGN